MPQPTQTDVHVNTPLTNISIAFMQDTSVFVAARAAPIVPVQKQSDSFYTYNRDDWFRLESRQRAPSTESAGSGYEVSTSTYRADVWAIHKDIDDQTRANADTVISPDRTATLYLSQNALIRKDKQWVIEFKADRSLVDQMVPKGSIAINGVSLTLVDAAGENFSVAIIPTTLADTTLPSLTVGEKVNIEADILGKYVRRYLQTLLASSTGQAPASSGGLTMEKLKQAGFM